MRPRRSLAALHGPRCVRILHSPLCGLYAAFATHIRTSLAIPAGSPRGIGVLGNWTGPLRVSVWTRGLHGGIKRWNPPCAINSDRICVEKTSPMMETGAYHKLTLLPRGRPPSILLTRSQSFAIAMLKRSSRTTRMIRPSPKCVPSSSPSMTCHCR